MFSFYILFIFIVLCGADGESTFTPEVETDSLREINCTTNLPEDLSGYFQTENYPKPYPAKSICLNVAVDPGYFIQLTVEDFNIDSTKNDYVLIQPGEANEERKGIILVWNVEEREYVIPSNYVHLEFNSAIANKNYTGFKIKWERYGNATSTTETPTTTENYPNPGPNDVYVVHLAGMPPNQFPEKVALFTEMLAKKAQIFCDDPANNITLRENITSRNVQITVALPCPYGWPRRDTCTEVTFAIPVLLNHLGDYQLNGTNLARIWASVETSDLPTPLSRYTKPTATSALTTWLSVFLVLTVAFLVFMLAVQQCGRRLDPRKRRTSDAMNLTPTKRDSDVKEWPHILKGTPRQTTPQLYMEMENYEELGYTSYHNNPGYVDDEETIFSAASIHNQMKETGNL